ncbi:MAG TPA: cellulase family glycosylhydrolase [Solirubrobacteraceae bacterium]
MNLSRRRAALGWLAAAVVLAVIAVLTAVIAFSGPGKRGGKAAAAGNRRFAHAAASCSPQTLSAPASSGAPPLLLGISASIRLEPGAYRCEQTLLAAQTGVRAVREDISWALTEPHENQYDWSNYDAVVRTATEAGLTVLPILDDAPAWAAPGEGCLPSAPGGYAAFTAASVARYGPGGTFWRDHPDLPARPLLWYELWNEPWDAACNRDPATYARMVAAAANAARAVDPGVRFLIGADTSFHTLAGRREDWIGGMYAAVPDLGRYFDAVSVHPYGGDPDVYTPGSDTDNQPGRLEQVHAEFAAHGDANKPLWVTEIGWSTCVGGSGCVTEAEQARYLEEFLHDAVTIWRSYVRAVFVYDLRDIAPTPADDPEAWFGLLRPDLSRKPAWSVLHDFTDRLRG